jgi:hypothetical protein
VVEALLLRASLARLVHSRAFDLIALCELTQSWAYRSHNCTTAHSVRLVKAQTTVFWLVLPLANSECASAYSPRFEGGQVALTGPAAMVFIKVNLEAARIGSDVALPSGGLLRSFANSKSTG